jgi:hypothetical protein
MKRRKFIPSSIAPLDQRIALSHALAHQPVLVLSQRLNPYGLALGSDKTTGTRHELSASGAAIAPLGQVSLVGALWIPNKVGRERPVHGTVSLVNRHGSVTLSLTGTVTVSRGSFLWDSGNLKYQVMSGTKAYRGARGSGSVLYGPGPVFEPGRFMLDFGGYPPPP